MYGGYGNSKVLQSILSRTARGRLEELDLTKMPGRHTSNIQSESTASCPLPAAIDSKPFDLFVS